ncbi:Lmo0654 family protein [Listeria aquatica]|uniref:Uncharacterized protein n=2 Tax=Listeria aquatica TaxID=1494960 RepID=W7BE43_9LIST|nr:Lmo0654 family protein [Listeria aquatica]EUJ21406.1 hypothetical protein MAQA_01607 [Listeria aquatica FSL S10-1188]MBC1522036.1 hypothetical protein [Listeria aquatica]
MNEKSRQDLEDRLIELRREYQEVVADPEGFEDPMLQNGPINSSEMRLGSIRREIKEIEEKLRKDPID